MIKKKLQRDHGKAFTNTVFGVVFFFLVTPHRNCRLKLLKLERIKDYLLLEEEFIQNQERLKPQEEKNEVQPSVNLTLNSTSRLHVALLLVSNTVDPRPHDGA